MLLAVDIGNSTISTGLFGLDGELRFLASLDTDYRKTADQICVDLMNLFQLYHFRYEDVTDSILCSVVPPLNFMMEKALTRLLGKPPVVVGPGVKTGLNIRLAVQSQVGADIVADAVSALEQFTAPIITIDMGTATTIGVISEGRTYEGGLLLPGVNVSLEALSRRAAQLPAISLQAPKNLIGKSTEDCMRSGIVYGTAAMLDGIIDRIRGEFPGKELHIVATGGSVAECESNYRQMLARYNLIDPADTEPSASDQGEVTGVIADLRSAVMDGNTWYYLQLSDGTVYYTISAAEAPEAVILNVGDTVTVKYAEGKGSILQAYSVAKAVPAA